MVGNVSPLSSSLSISLSFSSYSRIYYILNTSLYLLDLLLVGLKFYHADDVEGGSHVLCLVHACMLTTSSLLYSS